MELLKNQTYEVNIEGCTAEGQGVARIDGRAVFVAGALPGERCIIKLLKVSKTAIWAKLEELLCQYVQRMYLAKNYSSTDSDNACSARRTFNNF